MTEPTNRFQFTKTAIDALPFELKGKQKSYYDTNSTGLMLRVGEFSKTFYLQARIRNGDPVRVAIGKYGKFTINQAKDEAVKIQAKLNAGINPIEETRKVKQEAVVADLAGKQTLEWLLLEYKQKHLIEFKGGSESSIKGIDDAFNYFNERSVKTLKKDPKDKTGKTWIADKTVTLKDMLKRPFREITKSEIQDRFEVFKVALPTRPGSRMEPIKRTHQLSFKNVSIAYNWIIPRIASKNKHDVIENPVSILGTFKEWRSSEARTNYLDFKNEECYLWWNAVDQYSYFNYVVRDYIFVSLLQGGRSIDLASIEWKHINLKNKTIHYVHTKNKLDYLFPMTDMVYEILKARHDKKTSQFVFEYAKSKKTGHIVKNIHHHLVNIAEVSGIRLSHHDFRRTITSAASISAMLISEKMTNHILKHKLQGVDRHYFMKDNDELKIALQKIEDYYLTQVAYFRAQAHERLNSAT